MKSKLLKSKLYFMSLLLTTSFVLTGCNSASASDNKTIDLLSKAVEKIRKSG